MLTNSSRVLFVLVTSAALILQACGTHTYHVVESGDTLYSIGWSYGYDYKQLAAWNDIEPPYVIREGQVIRLVSPGRTSSDTKSESSVASSAKPAPPASKAKVAGLDKKNPAATEHENPGRVTTQKTAKVREAKVSSAAAKKLLWKWPTQGALIQTFSPTHPTRKGIKIAGRSGQRVTAAASGRVVYSGSGLIGYGKLIIIKHDDIFLSAYGHNRRILVAEGDFVRAGQQIAEMGRSGADRVMLHFEIRRNGQPTNPMALLPKPVM